MTAVLFFAFFATTIVMSVKGNGKITLQNIDNCLTRNGDTLRNASFESFSDFESYKKVKEMHGSYDFLWDCEVSNFEAGFTISFFLKLSNEIEQIGKKVNVLISFDLGRKNISAAIVKDPNSEKFILETYDNSVISFDKSSMSGFLLVLHFQFTDKIYRAYVDQFENVVKANIPLGLSLRESKIKTIKFGPFNNGDFVSCINVYPTLVNISQLYCNCSSTEDLCENQSPLTMANRTGVKKPIGHIWPVIILQLVASSYFIWTCFKVFMPKNTILT